MATVKHSKVVAGLPGTLVADTLYFVRAGAGFDLYLTNHSGTIVAYGLNKESIPRYVSTQQTYANAGELTLNHGLPGVPASVWAFLVCVDAEGGYPAGTVMPAPVTPDTAGVANLYGMTLRVTATQLRARIGAAGFALMNEPGGTGFAATPAKWRIVFGATR